MGDVTTRYAIVGGGIAGASIAYHLSRRTTDPITLYERGTPAAETTGKSVAQFGFYGDETQYRMKRYGMRVYNRFFRAPRGHPRYHFAGLLSFTTDRGTADRFERAVATGDPGSVGRIAAGGDRDSVEYLSGDDISARLLAPPLQTEAIRGAIYRPSVGYMSRPAELAREFLDRAMANGVRVQSGTTVADIETKRDRVHGIVTADGDRASVDHLVCAAGPWNLEVADRVGVDLPVGHTLAPILKLEPPADIEYDVPVLTHHDSPFAFHRRTPTELLVGYNPGPDHATRYDPSDVPDTVPGDIRSRAMERLEEFVPAWMEAQLVDEWVGVRSQTPDGNPIVGWTALEGFSIAAFHTSGIQLSPAVGRVIAEQLVDGEPTEFYDHLSITRFDGYADHP